MGVGGEIFELGAKVAKEAAPVALRQADRLKRYLLGDPNVKSRTEINTYKQFNRSNPDGFSEDFLTGIKDGSVGKFLDNYSEEDALNVLEMLQGSELTNVRPTYQALVGKAAHKDVVSANIITRQAQALADQQRVSRNITQQNRTRELNYTNLRQTEGGGMAKAQELSEDPAVIQQYDERGQSINKLEQDAIAIQERGKKPFGSEGAFKKESRFISSNERAVRSLRDEITRAPTKVNEEYLGRQGEHAYKVKPGVTAKTAHRSADQGWRPDNAGFNEKLHQHHLFPNAEARWLFQQDAVKESNAFQINIHRYIAAKYDAALGSAAKNMSNLPEGVHSSMLHPWLRKLGLEEYWKNLYKKNPRMTPQEILDAIDIYFNEIVYPTMVMLEDWMKQADPSQFNVKDVHIPPRLLKQARERVKEILNQPGPPDFTRGGAFPQGSATYDALEDAYIRQTGDLQGGNLRVPGGDLRKALEGP